MKFLFLILVSSLFSLSLSLSLSKRGVSSGGGYKKMKTDERDEMALFSSPVFLQSSALFSLSREVCVVYICSCGIYGEKFASHESKTEKHETAKNTSQSFHTNHM